MPRTLSGFSIWIRKNPFLFFALLALALAILRWMFPERHADTKGIRALFDLIFTLGLSSMILLVAGGVGLRILRVLRITYCSELETGLLSSSLGFGVIAYGIFALGLLRLLHPWTILVWIILIGVIFRHELSQIILGLWDRLPNLYKTIPALSANLKGLLLLFGAILLLTGLQALTPPWDADGLIYHLQVPRMWLSFGGIQPLSHFWEANYPLTIEAIYTLGLAFGSDTFAKVIHLIFAIILVLGTFSFARRFINARFAWISSAILIGIPIFPLWASSSYTDMGWAVYEFISIYSLFLWRETKDGRLLILSGLLSGFAIGCKYAALFSFGILGIWILWQSRHDRIKQIILNGTLFGISALVVGSPWYIKNFYWFQNPIYPLSFGRIFPSGDVDNLWMQYMWDGFGTGKHFIDYLLIPWNIFAHRERFSTFAGSIEVPSPLFLLSLLYPFVRKNRLMDPIAILACFRFIAWMFGVQQTRLLLPIFPLLSLLTSEVVLTLTGRVGSIQHARIWVTGIIGGMVAATLFYSVLLFSMNRPLGVIVGLESKSDYLNRIVADYPGMQFIQTKLPQDSKTLMMWDGRGYYCDSRCLPDTDHSQWTRLAVSEPDVISLTSTLRQIGITHLFLSSGDADFILQHDPDGQHLKALKYFLNVYRPACTREIYLDQWVTIYEITCRS